MPNYKADLDAESALDHNLQEKRATENTVYAARGDTDCKVTLGTGDLGTTGEGALSVNAGTPLVDGTKQPFEAVGALDVRAGDGKPRKDLVVADANGPRVVEGTPEAARYSGLIDSPESAPLTKAHRPAPPDVDAVTGVALAMISVAVEATTISGDDITDLRSFAVRERVDAKTSSIGELSVTEGSSNLTRDLVAVREFSGAASIAVTGLPTYDNYIIRVSDLRKSSVTDLVLRVNGDAGTNYKYITNGGAITSGADSYLILPSAGSHVGTIEITGRWSVYCGIMHEISTYSESGHASGRNDAVTSPLTSIELVAVGGTASGKIAVVGEDLIQ